MSKPLPQLTKLTHEWPAVGMHGCSVCGRVASTMGPHWCEPRKDWADRFDLRIRYQAVEEKAR